MRLRPSLITIDG